MTGLRDAMIARARELGVTGEIDEWTNAQLLDVISERLPPGHVAATVAEMQRGDDL